MQDTISNIVDKPEERPKPEPPSIDEITDLARRRIRDLRKDRGWSLDELSDRCSVSRSMLSEIERGRANPTLAVTLRIAHAFDISLSDLVDAEPPKTRIEVIRGNDLTYKYRRDETCSIRTLSPLQLEKDVEFYEIKFAKGGELRSSAHFEGTREFLTVSKGQVEVETDTEIAKLKSGDSASYRADNDHAIVNAGRGDAVVFLVVIYQ